MSRRLTSDVKEQAEEEREEEVCLPGLSAELLLRGKSMSESQLLSPQTHKDNCFHGPESLAEVFRCREDYGVLYRRKDGRVRRAGRRKSHRRN